MSGQQVSSVKQYFDTLNERFIASAAKGVKATFQFELSGDGGRKFFRRAGRKNAAGHLRRGTGSESADFGDRELVRGRRG